MGTAILKPGILVSLKSNVTGGVTYDRTELENTKTEDGERRKRMETEITIADEAEHTRAIEARGKARSLIAKQCAATAFGLICPEHRETALDEAVREARTIVDAFNETAQFTRISIYTIKGRIASTDEEAARAIASDVTDLIGRMDAAIDKLDPKEIRKAADQARTMMELLDDSQKATVSAAVMQARKAARMIVSRVQKKSEEAAIVLKDIQRGDLEKARIAFLDMDDAAAPVPATEATPAVQDRALDMDDDVEPVSEPAPSSDDVTGEEQGGETLAAAPGGETV